MLNWYDWVFMGVGIVIIILCLLQGGKSEGASGAITGGGLKTKERGAEKVVSILTLAMAIVFFIIALVIQVTSASKAAATTSSETSEAALRLLF